MNAEESQQPGATLGDRQTSCPLVMLCCVAAALIRAQLINLIKQTALQEHSGTMVPTPPMRQLLLQSSRSGQWQSQAFPPQ